MTDRGRKWLTSFILALVFIAPGLYLVLHGMSFIGGGIVLLGMLVKTFLTDDPTFP